MGFMDILNQYVEGGPHPPPSNAPEHFDQVARSAPLQEVANGLADVFREHQTPPFAAMVAQLFGNSNPMQKAGLLNELVASLGPSVISTLSPSPLADLLRRLGAPATQVTPEQASAITPQQVQTAAHEAERQKPDIVDKVSQFYAQHPALLNTLGATALTIALAKMAQHGNG